MRRSIGCLLIGVLALAALNHLAGWPLGAPPPQTGGMGFWGALSFALAAVVDTDRAA